MNKILWLILFFLLQSCALDKQDSMQSIVVFILELFALLIIFRFQFNSWRRDRAKIVEFGKIFPKKGGYILQSQKGNATSSDDDSLEIAESKVEHTFNSNPVSTIQLIDSNYSNPVLLQILEYINAYLTKNKNAIADFHLIKDIVERTCEVKDEEIHFSLPSPLYLGLMGTMVGICIGLGNLAFHANTMTEANSSSITTFLINVSLAMVVSMMGLFFTTINNHYYKIAKHELEQNKNDFFTFIQTELMPIMSDDVTANLFKLQENFSRFGENFSEKTIHLEKFMDTNIRNIEMQDNLMKQIKEMNFVTIADSTVKVFQELNHTSTHLSTFLKEFQKFEKHLNKISGYFSEIDSRRQLVSDGVSQVDSNIGKVFQGFIQAMEDHKQQISNSFSSQFQFVADQNRKVQEGIDGERQKIQNSYSEFGISIQKSLTAIQETNQNQLNLIKRITEEETVEIQKAFKENRNQFKKFDNLDKLQILDGLVKHIESQATFLVTKENEIKKQIEVLNQNITGMISSLNAVTAREAAANDSLQKLNQGINSLLSAFQANQSVINQAEILQTIKTNQEISQKQQTEFAEKINAIVGSMNKVSDTINVNMNKVIVQFQSIQEKTINGDISQSKHLTGKLDFLHTKTGKALLFSGLLLFGWKFGCNEKYTVQENPLFWSEDLGEMQWEKAVEKCIEMDKRLPFQKEILASFNKNNEQELKGDYWVTFESDLSLEQYTISLNNDEKKSYSIKKKNSAKLRCVSGL